MCIVFIAIDQHPEYPLMIAANRDEFHERPTASMDFWTDYPDVLAGKDLRKGGTWLGINRTGRFCSVTNYKSDKPVDGDALSRGILVKMFLAECPTAEDFIDFLFKDGHQYGPFNIVFGHYSSLYTYSNENKTLSNLTPGFHGISNGPMDDPWPKMLLGVNRFTDLISSRTRISIETLNQIMRDNSQPAATLPHHTMGGALSPVFICSPHYGTRATSYVFYSHNNIEITELNYDSTGSIIETREFLIQNYRG